MEKIDKTLFVILDSIKMTGVLWMEESRMMVMKCKTEAETWQENRNL